MINNSTAKKKTDYNWGSDGATTYGSGLQIPATGVQVGAAAGGPASPSAAPTGSPVNPSQTSAINAAGYNLSNVLSQIAASKPMLQSAYGYTDSGDVDPSNPFSRASLLQKNYQTSQKDNTNSYAAKGQLYAGSLQNAQNTSQGQYQQGDSQLRGEYAQQLASLAQQQANAQAQYGISVDGANMGAVGDAVGSAAPVVAATPTSVPNSDFAAKVAARDPATMAFIASILDQQLTAARGR